MLIERLHFHSLIEVEKDSIALIAAACNALSKGAATIDELWPGTQRSLPS